MSFHKFLFKILFSVSLALLFSVGFALPARAQSASLYLSPSTGTYTVGNTFLVQVKVNSGGVAINAADGTLIFDVDDLEVKSISKEGSIFTLWVQEPVFSNSLGTINFAGGKPSPGFTGAAGTIINITFKAKTAGTANLTFASGSVLADDGKGTNILANMGSGVYSLTGREITPLPPEEKKYVPPAVVGQPPAAPIISSPTHSDENKWYSNNDPDFNWKLPADVTGVSLVLDESPTSKPGPKSDGLIELKKFEDVENGIRYFHIKFKNQQGWGKITHRKVLIDTRPPEPFKVVVDNENDQTNPTPTFLFETEDLLSGMEYYEVILNEKSHSTTTPTNIKAHPYKPLPLLPGKYTLKIKAFDKAGNWTIAGTEIEVLPIETPVIRKIPKTVLPEQSLTVEGKSLPDVLVRILIQKKGQEPKINEVKSDKEGNWSFTSPTILEKGDYLIWAQAQDKREALSLPSDKFTVAVSLPPFIKFGTIVISYLLIMTTLLFLIGVLILIIFYIWYRISLWRKKLKVETKELSQAIFGAFKALKEEVEEQIEYLDKKPGLTKEEKKIRDRLQESLNISEQFIGKELKDIEKELE